LTGALPVVSEDAPDVFKALIEALCQRAAGGPWSHVLIGLHAADPLLRVARRYQAACYVTHLFLVSWEDGDPARLAVDSRAPYLELGSL
jgi:hypothetical protein